MKKESDAINICLSGWNASGTTTITMLLALIFNRKYLHLGSVMRHLSNEFHEKYGKDLTQELEEDFQPTIGKTTDNYLDYKLLHDSGLIVESDLSSFRIGKHPKVFSIFIKADQETRRKRFKKDRRTREAPMEERDSALQSEYMKLWGVDIFNTELITKKYNLIIDNSDLTVREEIEAILSRLKEHPHLKSQIRWSAVEKRAEKYLKLYEKKNKAALQKELEKKGLAYPVKQILLEIVQMFPEDVETFPDDVQKIFLGQHG